MIFSLFRSNGYFTYHQIQKKKKNSAVCHALYWSVLFGSQNKLRLFPYTYSVKGVIYVTQTECLLRGTDWI
jgi:hypothetical protein